MPRPLVLTAGFAVLMGAGVALTPRGAMTSGMGGDDGLLRAYERVEPGMPAAELAQLGFDLAKAHRLSKPAMMENFMPRDRAAFGALDQAVRDCYMGGQDCNAYIFVAFGARAVLLVHGGRVTWKAISSVAVA